MICLLASTNMILSDWYLTHAIIPKPKETLYTVSFYFMGKSFITAPLFEKMFPNAE